MTRMPGSSDATDASTWLVAADGVSHLITAVVSRSREVVGGRCLALVDAYPLIECIGTVAVSCAGRVTSLRRGQWLTIGGRLAVSRHPRRGREARFAYGSTF